MTPNISSYRTQIDDNYGTCERTKVTLRIDCGSRHPEEITAFLDIRPTTTVENGAAVMNEGDNTGRIGKFNLWFLDSEGDVTSKDLRRHLDWLLDKIEPSASQILSLRESGVPIDVLCVWWSKYGDGGPTLWPKQMRRLADLDLELSIDFADYSEEGIS